MSDTAPQKDQQQEKPDQTEKKADRRQFLRQGLRRAAYVAPVVMLLKPPQAVAGSGGSLITPGP